ncbi:MAG: YkgJ family cysteine cluster protein [Lachnospiraceae bacterium]|nr:YkgJ family cysteine cluster protein [Lachnospiraceae bacterium]
MNISKLEEAVGPYRPSNHLLTGNDMARVACGDCAGCSKCCHEMTDTIKVSPYDLFLLRQGLGLSFEQLLERYLDLTVDHGVILPHLAMEGEDEHCVFLGENGRCTIHPYRTGLCRTFPLGRNYDNETHALTYFVLEGACYKKDQTKVKVKKWLDTPRLAEYEAYLVDWHYYVKDLQERSMELLSSGKQEEAKALAMALLQQFYYAEYDLEGDFYEQYYRIRRQAAR